MIMQKSVLFWSWFFQTMMLYVKGKQAKKCGPYSPLTFFMPLIPLPYIKIKSNSLFSRFLSRLFMAVNSGQGSDGAGAEAARSPELQQVLVDSEKHTMKPPPYSPDTTVASDMETTEIRAPPPPYCSTRSGPLPLLAVNYGNIPRPEGYPSSCSSSSLRRKPLSVRCAWYLKSWKAVILEARWTFVGCCSCLFLIILVIVIVVTVTPRLNRGHFHH